MEQMLEITWKDHLLSRASRQNCENIFSHDNLYNGKDLLQFQEIEFRKFWINSWFQSACYFEKQNVHVVFSYYCSKTSLAKIILNLTNGSPVKKRFSIDQSDSQGQILTLEKYMATWLDRRAQKT